MQIFFQTNESKNRAVEITDAAKKILKEISDCNFCDDVSECDFIITVGGDGTILRMAKQATFFGKPILGINAGNLGFMTAIETKNDQNFVQMREKLEYFVKGNYTISSRIMLEIKNKKNCGNFLALNDIVFKKNCDSKIPDFEIFQNHKAILKVPADGLILSTPTGSTAYSLSAGGAVIEPESQCIQLSTICPHTLFSRSMIFGADKTLSVKVPPMKNECVQVRAEVDGDFIDILDPTENEIFISRAPQKLLLVSLNDSCFYDTLRNKLMKPLK